MGGVRLLAGFSITGADKLAGIPLSADTGIFGVENYKGYGVGRDNVWALGVGYKF